MSLHQQNGAPHPASLLVRLLVTVAGGMLWLLLGAWLAVSHVVEAVRDFEELSTARAAYEAFLLACLYVLVKRML
jgi:uncharacterized membrane protein YccF (DUF307 family)